MVNNVGHNQIIQSSSGLEIQKMLTNVDNVINEFSQPMLQELKEKLEAYDAIIDGYNRKISSIKDDIHMDFQLENLKRDLLNIHEDNRKLIHIKKNIETARNSGKKVNEEYYEELVKKIKDLKQDYREVAQEYNALTEQRKKQLNDNPKLKESLSRERESLGFYKNQVRERINERFKIRTELTKWESKDFVPDVKFNKNIYTEWEYQKWLPQLRTKSP